MSLRESVTVDKADTLFVIYRKAIMITVATTRPVQVEAMRFTGDNIVEMREFVAFTGHRFQLDNPPGTPDKFYIDQRPGVILTVVKGEWLVYNLSDATWRVFSDKDFQRQFRTQS